MLGTLVQIAKEMLHYESEGKEISEELITNHLCDDPRRTMLERGRRKKEEMKVLSVDLKEEPRFRLEDYRNDERWKYLYALSTGKRGIGTSWIVDLEKKKDKEAISKEIAKGIKEIKNGLKRLLKEKHVEWLDKCSENMSMKEKEFAEHIRNTVPDTRFLFTIQYDGEKGGEVPDVLNVFTRVRLVGETRARSSGEHVCALCGEKDIVRPSFPSKFTFSGYADKPIFSPMAFEVNSWKCAPLCYECTKWLFIAADFLDTNLRARVAGRWAYLLPDLEAIEASGMPSPFVQYLYEFRKRTEDRIIPELQELPEADEEPNIFESLLEEYVVKEPEPFKSLSLIFHQKMPGGKFLFLQSTSSIMFNQLRKLSENLKKLRRECSKQLGELGKDLSRELRGDLRFVGEAWRWPSEQKILGSPLKLNPMNLAESLLTQNPPDYNVFMSDVDKILKCIYTDAITNKIRTAKQIMSDRIMLIWAVHVMFYGDLKGERKNDMFQSLKVSPEEWNRFFEEKKVLDTDEKRGIFLVGALYGRTEYAQRREREDWKGEMPILSSLRGLTIAPIEIKERLFPQLVLKLRQLSAHSLAISEVEAQASYYLVRGGGIADEEARFIFCLGWALDEHVMGFINETSNRLGMEEEDESE